MEFLALNQQIGDVIIDLKDFFRILLNDISEFA